MKIFRWLRLRKCKRGVHRPGHAGLHQPWEGPSTWNYTCVDCGHTWREYA